MATYNGDRFVREQVESILEQLHPDDELIVVDDASKDDTAALVEGFPDPRLRLFRHERNAGYVRTFEEALTKASGEILLLSDQDDVWLPGHREVLARAARTSGVAAPTSASWDDPAVFPAPMVSATGPCTTRTRDVRGATSPPCSRETAPISAAPWRSTVPCGT
jgi:glycosyltransferase involved in cell wall biosynthesis